VWRRWKFCNNILGNPGKVTMEKCNTAYLVSLQCEESNHYSSSSCQLSAVLTLLVAVHFLSWMQNGKSMWRLKMWGTARVFYSTQRAVFASQEYNFTKYTTLLHAQIYILLCHAYGPLMERAWSVHGTLLLWMDQLQSWIKSFFPEQLSLKIKTLYYLTDAQIYNSYIQLELL